MTLVRLASLIGVALLVMVLNVAMSFLYMVVYGYLINPGHPKGYYDEHIKVAAPYCSIVAGIPLMFLAGLWVAGWGGSQGPLGGKAVLVVWVGLRRHRPGHCARSGREGGADRERHRAGRRFASHEVGGGLCGRPGCGS